MHSVGLLIVSNKLQFIYNIKYCYRAAGSFTLDPDTGELTTKKSLDREETSFYEFVVLAVDMGSPQLSASATVAVYIHDLNDHPPVFVQELYTVNILEGWTPGRFLKVAVGFVFYYNKVSYGFVC